MDRNQIIGLLLVTGLLVVYLQFFSSPTTQQTKDEKVITTDTLNSSSVIKNLESISTLQDTSLLGVMDSSLKEVDVKEITLSNSELEVSLSSLGGSIKSTKLKNHKTFEGKDLYLVSPENSQFQWILPSKKGDISLSQLPFKVKNQTENSVIFETTLGEGRTITQKYSLSSEGFELHYELLAPEIESLLREPSLHIDWSHRLQKVEFDLEQSRLRSSLNYYTQSGSFEEVGTGTSGSVEEVAEEKVQWIGMKQRFFTSAFITSGIIENASFQSETDKLETAYVKDFKTRASIPVNALSGAKMKFFFGPNEYSISKTIAPGFEDNVYLGWAVLAPVSRFIILPMFYLLEHVVSNYGLLIIIMVLIIKFVLSPLTYKSSLSQAKMKLLQPELAKIKEKCGDDQVLYSQKQMELFNQVGASPLSGCLPMVLQMPIFFSLFTFFPNAIQLRQQSFLWAHDLSNYDSIWDLGFSIPFYGDHVSLFTLLMSASQIIYTHFNAQTQSMGSAQSPINMKAMMYGLPVVFIFVLNSFPSGLTLYYFVSNVVTIVQTLAIQKLFVDDAKVMAILESNRAKIASGEKKGGFMARIAEAQKKQQEAMEKEKKGKK